MNKDFINIDFKEKLAKYIASRLIDEVASGVTTHLYYFVSEGRFYNYPGFYADWINDDVVYLGEYDEFLVYGEVGDVSQKEFVIRNGYDNLPESVQDELYLFWCRCIAKANALAIANKIIDNYKKEVLND